MRLSKGAKVNPIQCVSVDEPDWSREKPRRFWDPGRQLLRTIWKYQAYTEDNVSFIGKFCQKYWVIEHRLWSVITGAEIDLSCQIGSGLLTPYPNGIVIHPKSTIGANFLILQQVTLAGTVELGGHVDIGAGAKLLGPLKVNDNARIGANANAFVTKDVKAGVTVVGAPAKEIG